MKKAFSLVLAILFALLVFSSCEFLSDEENIGGDTKSMDHVTFDTGIWNVEDITESPSGECDKNSGCVSEGRLYFHTSKASGLLIDSNGSLLWLYSENSDVFAPFNTGDYVKVSHGAVMESYPGQTYVSRVALVENGDAYSLTDEDWEKLEGIFVDIERPSPLTKPEEITEGSFVGNDSGGVSEGRLYFAKSKDKALILDTNGSIMWLYATDKSLFAPFNTGDKVRVSHGAVMMSYPGQTNISKIALIENGDVNSFTSEELERLDLVSDGFN